MQHLLSAEHAQLVAAAHRGFVQVRATSIHAQKLCDPTTVVDVRPA
jgi:hypothetical protein